VVEICFSATAFEKKGWEFKDLANADMGILKSSQSGDRY